MRGIKCKSPPQGLFNWKDVVKYLGETGALNKKYDSDLDGVVDNAAAVGGHVPGTSAGDVLVLNTAGQVPLSNLPLIPDSQLDFSFAWEKVAVVEASTSVQSISVTGLAGDTDKWYFVLYEHVPVSSTANQSTMVCLNADYTSANYAWAGYGNTPTNTWGGGTQGFGSTSGTPGLPFVQTYAGEPSGIGIAYINAAGRTVGTTTYVSMCSLVAPAIHGWMIGLGQWKKSAEVTEINIYCPGGTYIGAGSKVYVFKPKW